MFMLEAINSMSMQEMPFFVHLKLAKRNCVYRLVVIFAFAVIKIQKFRGEYLTLALQRWVAMLHFRFSLKFLHEFITLSKINKLVIGLNIGAKNHVAQDYLNWPDGRRRSGLAG